MGGPGGQGPQQQERAQDPRLRQDPRLQQQQQQQGGQAPGQGQQGQQQGQDDDDYRSVKGRQMGAKRGWKT
jgi:hypothetical protein